MKKIFLFLSIICFTKAQTKILVPAKSFTNNCEGPAFDKLGNFYVVNFGKDGTLAKFNSKGKLINSLTLPDGSIGNGIQFLDSKTAFVVDFINHRIYKLDPYNMTISIFAENKEMNQPNDLAIKSDGNIFCSDPSWKNSSGNIWLVDKNGNTKKLASDMGTTNGIELSPSEKVLYVNESVQKNIWAFDILKDNSLDNKRLLYHFEEGGLDGMHADSKGNLYVTRWGMGKIDIISPIGKLLDQINTQGKSTSNLAFGGKNGKTVIITLQDTGAIETFKAKTSGKAYKQMKKWVD